MTVFLFIISTLICSAAPDNPPGTVKQNDSLYVDRTEVTNAGWRECLHWYNQNYGDTSEQYLFMLPDETKWEYIGVSFEMYFRHPRYQSYPVVCVTYEQALVYCQWRSDRVNEWYYRLKNKIKFTENIDTSKQKIPVYVTYRLPSQEEWMNLSGGKDTIGPVISSPMPKETGDGEKNKKGIFQLAGNVSEMTSAKGIAKGSNYFQKEKKYGIQMNFQYKRPQPWLGFRCICEIKIPI